MNKQKALSISLFIFGSSLEVYYYIYRFYSDSGDFMVSAIQGIALTLLLIGLFTLRSKLYVWLLIVPLALFSVFSTASGQRQSLTLKAETQIININDQKIQDLENSIQRKMKRYSDIQEMVNNTVTDLESRWEWVNSTTRYEDEMDKIDSEVEAIRKDITDLRDPELKESEVGRLYKFYSDLIGWSPEWLQFWLQVCFSFFIAIMAPAALILYPNPPPKRRAPMKKSDQWRPYVERFVHTNWIGIRQGSHKNILSKDNFITHLQNRGFEFSSKKYDMIYNAAKRGKVVDNRSITLDNEKDAIEAIIKILGR